MNEHPSLPKRSETHGKNRNRKYQQSNHASREDKLLERQEKKAQWGRRTLVALFLLLPFGFVFFALYSSDVRILPNMLSFVGEQEEQESGVTRPPSPNDSDEGEAAECVKHENALIHRMEVHTVLEGETLEWLAVKYYDELDCVVHLYDANPDINANKLRSGDQVRIPIFVEIPN
ncbi:MAG: LysM peptidoglycan-binding domain-containing protein [Bacilli bacterium]